MQNYFPFEVNLIGDAEQMYQLYADFEAQNLLPCKFLLDKYSSPEGLISLVDITALIIQEKAPALPDCIDFDEESYLLDMHVDSAEALQLFASTICPV